MAFITGQRPMSPDQGMMWLAYKYPGMFTQPEEPEDPLAPTFRDFSDYANYQTMEFAKQVPEQLGAVGAWWARSKLLQPLNDIAAYKGVPAWARVGNELAKFGEATYYGLRGARAPVKSLGSMMRAPAFISSVGMGPRMTTKGMFKGTPLSQELRAGTRTAKIAPSSSIYDLARTALPTSAAGGLRSFLFWNFAVGSPKEFLAENRTDSALIFSVAKHVAWGAANKYITERFIRPGVQQLEMNMLTKGSYAKELKGMGLLDDAGNIVKGAEEKVKEIASRSMRGRTVGDRIDMLRSARKVAQAQAASEVKTGVFGGLRKAAGLFAAGQFGPSTRTTFDTLRTVGGKALTTGLSALNVANSFSGVFAVKNIIDAFNSYQHDMRKELLKGAFTRDFAFEQRVPIGPEGTERSRAIEAIQNSSLNARSYLGNEAAIMR